MLVIGGVIVAAAVWSLIWPIQAYRERGPLGQKASCGGAIGGIENDEVCWDIRNERRSGWLPILVLGSGVVIGGASLTVAARSVQRSVVRDGVESAP